MQRTIPLLAVLLLVVAPLPAGALFEGETVTTHNDEPSLESVTIVRDEFGVPHIYAEDEEALWYANGYVQAQDRLWAMDLLRHLGYGEGASLVGPGGGILEMDMNTRRDLYNRSQLETMAEGAAPEFQRAVQAFADGVNRAAAEMHATGEMPAEFAALQHAFEPWKPLDTVAVSSFLLAEFGNGGGAELSNAALLGQLEDALGSLQAAQDAMADLNWDERGQTAYSTIPATQMVADAPGQPEIKAWDEVHPAQQEATLAAMEARTFGLTAEPILPSLPSAQSQDDSLDLDRLDWGYFEGEDIDFQWGSNALVVAPELSENGKALMGGGPQMGFFNPQIPYEIGLHLEDGSLEAEGMGVTGAPGFIIGRTANFALTVTSGISDQTDIIALEADGERSYTWDGETRELDCREETHVLFTPPATGGPAVGAVNQEICFSHLGPIVAITEDEDQGPAWFFAERTSSRMLEVASAVNWLTVSQREDLEDFRDMFRDDPTTDAFDGFAFTFNFHYAGIEDADVDAPAPENQVACYHHVGLQPVRNMDLDPRLPTPPGEAWQWEGMITGDELPWACNPDQGYYANWNNRPAQGWSSGDSRELWGSIHRVERLDREVQQKLFEKGDGTPDSQGLLDLDDVQEILKRAATEDSLAHQIVPKLEQNDPGTAAAAFAALEDWKQDDYVWRSSTPEDHEDDDVYVHQGHTVYDKLLPQLLEEVFGDELGDHLRDVNLDPRNSSDPHAGDHGQHNNPFAVLVDALDGELAVWCDDVTTAGTESCEDQVEDALAATGLDQIGSVEELELTDEHRSPYTSLGAGPAFDMPMTNRATFYHFHVGDDVTQSFATLPAGISGHLSLVDLFVLTATGETPEHMDDQLPLYNDFAFKHLPWTQASAEATAESTDVLLVPTGLPPVPGVELVPPPGPWH